MLRAAIWVFVASIFLVDLFVPPQNVANIAVSFAYVVPILATLFEARSRPLFLAGMATTLSLAGYFVPPNEVVELELTASRLIAVLHQWVVALLVVLQKRLFVDALSKAEFQRRFIDILSHEVGTALTTVIGQAYRLTKLADALSPRDVRTRADKIRKAGDRIQAIVARIQVASSLGDGTIPLGQRPIDLQVVIRELTERLGEEHQRPIDMSLCPKPQFVHGDEMMLRHMLENIMTNSIKYSPAHAAISVSTAELGSDVCVTITDYGRGISRDELLRVRSPYYRGENSQGICGTGLGLYLVEQIVTAHRGRFSIESEIGQGTKVTVALPQAAGLAA